MSALSKQIKTILYRLQVKVSQYLWPQLYFTQYTNHIHVELGRKRDIGASDCEHQR